MNSGPDDQFCRMHELIAMKLDGASAPEAEAELQQLLRDDPDLRALYVQYIQDTAALRWSYAHTTVPMEDDRLAEADPRAPLAVAGRDEIDGRRSAPRWRWWSAAVAASLLLAAGAYYMGLRPDEPDAASVATITRTIDARWDERPYSELARLQVGETVSFEAGQIELIFDTGVEVVVIGPASFQINSAESIYSSRGTISARVGASGVGFTIDTPTARVIDLGTSFGVAVNDDGATEVAVFSGKVDLALGSSSRDDAGRRRLIQGEAVRVGPNGRVNRVTAIASDRFPVSASTRPGEGLATPIIADVRDNLRAGDSNKFYQIVRSGLHEDSPAFVDRNHQWNSVTAEGFPLDLEGAEYVMPFNDDKFHEDLEVSIDVTQPANVYVFYSDSMDPPKWLKEGFVDTGVDVGLDEAQSVYHKNFALGVGAGESVDMTFSVWKQEVRRPGVVQLGAVSKHRATLGYNMYGVAVTPLQSDAPAVAVQ
jgi:hypothetical protein